MDIKDIGFYTLSDDRIRQVSIKSPMWRCELIITDKCNFNCPYCRHVSCDDLSYNQMKWIIDHWNTIKLKNVRFSGGEPTLNNDLLEIVGYCKQLGVEHIAVSSNGSNEQSVYKELIDRGANDFSISLDGCCASDITKMSGGYDYFDIICRNIEYISSRVYCSVGVVLTTENIDKVFNIIQVADDLGVSDIRLITSAQWNEKLPLDKLDKRMLEKYPILRYRLGNTNKGIHIRGLSVNDSTRCGLCLDDSCIVDNQHYPCVIYMREGGHSIGKIPKIDSDHKEYHNRMRQERYSWYLNHNNYEDSICRTNCLDVCREYNNRFAIR